jgi:hypothetical protein
MLKSSLLDTAVTAAAWILGAIWVITICYYSSPWG